MMKMMKMMMMNKLEKQVFSDTENQPLQLKWGKDSFQRL